MHDQYGPIVRINPDELHIRDSKQYEVVYSGKRDKWPPAATMAGMEMQTFATVPHDLHRKRRAANMPLMGKRVIVDAVPLIHSKASKLRDAFDAAAGSGQPLELGVTCLAYTTDVVGEHFSQQSLGMQDDSRKARQWKTATHMIATMTPVIKQFPWFLKPALLLPPAVMDKMAPDMAALLGVHRDMQVRAKAFLDEVRHKPANHSGYEKHDRPATLFHSIYEHPGPPEEKSVTRLFQEGVNVIIAGSETTARVLTRALYELTVNRDALIKTRHELRDTATRLDRSVEELTLTELEHLPWLAAVIKEALRIAAIPTSRLPLQAHEPLQYKQWTTPAMTPVSLTPYDVLYDPDIFPEPSSFQPDRWLTASDDGTLELHTALERFFVIFGKGPRMCQGINLAYAELYLALAILITSFDLDLFDVVKERDIDYTADCFLGETRADSPGVRVLVKKIGPEGA
ncbi:hypothetical protein LTR36_008004 [Oleoguttula mirabilis]|uniref:Cytochrome P450 n=1 Tax=Oleoguttula mirabilis TaxID=1507867 RepID=A0AAV9J9I0_9PEZI|nr:hypothetical protein LTR36_008004 [Oleoguttula mirabilis]